MQLPGRGEPNSREGLDQSATHCLPQGAGSEHGCVHTLSLLGSEHQSQTSSTIQKAGPEDRKAKAWLERTDTNI